MVNITIGNHIMNFHYMLSKKTNSKKAPLIHGLSGSKLDVSNAVPANVTIVLLILFIFPFIEWEKGEEEREKEEEKEKQKQKEK